MINNLGFMFDFFLSMGELLLGWMLFGFTILFGYGMKRLIKKHPEKMSKAYEWIKSKLIWSSFLRSII